MNGMDLLTNTSISEGIHSEDSKREFYSADGGTMVPKAASYVSRRADDELFQALIDSSFCYILTSRQMGKSSLMAGTALRLRDRKITVLQLELPALGQDLTSEQWYSGIVDFFERELNLGGSIDLWGKTKRGSAVSRCIEAITELMPQLVDGNIVIFLDEIDYVKSLPFSTDEFFAAIRECYDRRASRPQLKRLTFCVLGVATPTDLICDAWTTPFNIGRRIELNDFTAEEAAPLAKGLRPDRALAHTLLNRILYWTGGHPYLTQQFCKAVSERPDIIGARGVDRVCQEIFLSHQASTSNNNLAFVPRRIFRIGRQARPDAELAQLLEIYRKVRSKKRIRNAEGNLLIAELCLSGIVRSENGFLRVRNRIYERVFDKKWIRENLPGQERRRQRAAYRRGILLMGGISAIVLGVVIPLAAFAFHESRLATERQHRTEVASKAAETQRAEAVAARTGANLRLAEARIAQGDALVINGKWEDARQAYMQGVSALKQEQRSSLPADLELLDVDAHSPAPLLVIRQGNSPSLPGAAWLGYGTHFSADGRTLLYGDRKSITRIEFPDVKIEHLKLPVPYASFISFSEDGKQAVMIAKPDVLVWDIDSRKEIAHWPLPDGGTEMDCYQIICQPDNQTVLLNRLPARETFLCDSHTGRVISKLGSKTFDPNTGARERVASILRERQSFRLGQLVDGVTAISRDGQEVAIGRQPLELFSMPDGKRLATLHGHTGPIETGIFSANRTRLATTGQDRTIRIWNTDNGDEMACLTCESHVETLSAMPDLHLICSGERSGAIKVWVAGISTDLIRLAVSGVRHLAFSSDGCLLLTEDEGMLKLWDTATGHLMQVFRQDQREGAVVATQPAQTQSLQTAPLPFALRAESIAIAPDSAYVLVTRNDGSLLVWSTLDGKVVYKQDSLGTDRLFADFLPAHGKLLLMSYGRSTPGGSTQCSIVDLRGPSVERRFPVLATVARPCLEPDGWDLCVLRPDKLVVYDVNTGMAMSHAIVQSQEGITPDNRIILAQKCKRAMIVRDESMSLYDLQSDQLMWTDSSNQSAIACGALSADGQLIARGTYDGAISIWESAPQGQMKTLKEYPNTDFQATVAFSPNGHLMATTTGGGAVVIRDLSRPVQLRKLQNDGMPPFPMRSNSSEATADLAKLGQWYALRGMDDWAAEVLDRARFEGADVQALMLARCYWQMHRYEDCERELRRSLKQHEAPPTYLKLCIEATAREQEAGRMSVN